MIAPGDIVPREDSSRELFVAVLSNSIHLAANTGRVITCPFIPGRIPGRIPDDAMALVVAIRQPEGTLLPELVQWLPSSALGEPIGAVGTDALGKATPIVAALIFYPTTPEPTRHCNEASKSFEAGQDRDCQPGRSNRRAERSISSAGLAHEPVDAETVEFTACGPLPAEMLAMTLL